MTSNAVPAGDDPRRLLADARLLARRVRLAQRVTWLPLLVLGLVTLGAIPVSLLGTVHTSDCRPVDDGQLCKATFPAGEIYWLGIGLVAYVVIAAGYLRVARARGVDARVLPFVITGVAVAPVVFALAAAGAADWILPEPEALHPTGLDLFLFRLLAPATGMGLALLVLAWLERHVALLLFTVGYLAVVLVPVDFGWAARSQWQFVPMLVIGGGVLLLGSAGFALAHRRRR
ncbi:hypothetical protein [Virgisporangium aurantiacum]|uniref:Uncharacterized protein n=1 Tax=Virgisporangium aurantiacum TaxID=175570 RepID=A0A8J3Z2B8_9ACTN|nr:hypothetical protein [Virgisporangium aurantiacum]GIJ55979.1 hypothetical protein Vau01_034950 [Virgisporangium aurantiacum]